MLLHIIDIQNGIINSRVYPMPKDVILRHGNDHLTAQGTSPVFSKPLLVTIFTQTMFALQHFSRLHLVAHRTFTCGRRWGLPCWWLRRAMAPTDFITMNLLIATMLTIALDGGTDETEVAESLDVWASHLPSTSVIRKYFTTMFLQFHLGF